MSFEQVSGRLTTLFGGAAAANADTYAGKIARVQVAFDEAKETVGAALLPILDKLLVFINQNALPAINAFSNAFSLTSGDGFGKVISDVGTTIRDTVQPIFVGFQGYLNTLKKVITENKDSFQAFWDVIKYIAPLIGATIGKAMGVVAKITEGVLTLISKVLGAIKPLLNTAIDGINLIIRGYNAVQFGKDIPYIPKIGASSGTPGFSGTMPNGQSFSTSGAVGSSGGVELDAKDAAILAAAIKKGEAEAKIIVAGQAKGLSAAESLAAAATSSTGAIASAESLGISDRANAERLASGTTINVTVNGAMDAEGTARTIVDTLNNSYYRGTGGATALVAI
jgi:phage-related protein